MLQGSACVEMMLQDKPMQERFQIAATCGAKACEIWGYAHYDFGMLQEAIAAGGIPLSSMCVGTKDASLAALYSEKALLCDDSADTFCRVVEASVKAAQQLGVTNLIVTTGQERDDRPRAQQHANLVLALRKAAKLLEGTGVCAVLEPLNVLHDHRGYFLSSTYEAFAVIREVDSLAVRLLFDIYHQQITDGNLIASITENIGLIGHFHVADTPGRREPGTGEINYHNVFAAIKKAGYNRYVGLEYAPSKDAALALRETIDMLQNA